MRRVRYIYISDKIFGPNFPNLICYECIQIYIILNTLCKILRQSDKTLVSRMDYYLLFSISFHIKTIVYYICERKKKKKECNMNIYPAHYLLKININVQQILFAKNVFEFKNAIYFSYLINCILFSIV